MKRNILLFLYVCVLTGSLVNTSCKETVVGPQASTVTAPPAYYLKQNYPNPFIDTTTIEYGVPLTGGSYSFVSIIVYDRYRQQIRILVNNGSHSPGSGFLTKWDGKNSKGVTVASGLYIIEMLGYTPQTTILQITAIKK
jgi:hypothetical protein